MVQYVGALLAMLAWLALIAVLHASREQPPRNRRVVHRDVKPVNVIPRNTRGGATASESGVRVVTPRNLRRANRSGQGGTRGAA